MPTEPKTKPKGGLRAKKGKTHPAADVSFLNVEMKLLEKDGELLSRDVEKSHWKTFIKIMCSVSETDISQVSLCIWNNCKP